MTLEGVGEQNNQNIGQRRNWCISLCRRFTYLDPVDGMPSASCKERSKGGFYGFGCGVLSGMVIAGTANLIIKAVVSSGISVSDNVISKIFFSTLGTFSGLGTVFGIAHPPRQPAYQAVRV